LGFHDIAANSIDAVSDRDFISELVADLALVMMHLSRLCEEVILWCSAEFGFLELDDAYSTGSSMMPQKKNPDVAELVRGKTGRVYGHLIGLLATLKALPLAYNKDMQEDKEGMFDTVKTVTGSLKIFAGMIRTMTVRTEHMKEATRKDFSNATELADYLSAKGVPFRESHEIVGKLVLTCVQKNCYLADLPLEEFKKAHPLFEEDIYEVLKPETAVQRRNSAGGTGFEQVRNAVKKARKILEEPSRE
ncbi:MAG: argininosuccinate lyase, partial [Bacillales bacterium]